jgi:CRP/FNR family transcriptional regulator, cyclic AMP receptor protein
MYAADAEASLGWCAGGECAAAKAVASHRTPYTLPLVGKLVGLHMRATGGVGVFATRVLNRGRASCIIEALPGLCCGIFRMAGRSKKAAFKNREFDLRLFLESGSVGSKIRTFKKRETIFSQGEPAQSVFYIQKGGVKVSIISGIGKEAVVAILGSGDFFGEGCLAGQALRIGTAAAVTPTTALVIEKKEMIRVLHEEHAFSDRFISYMLTKNIRIEEDLVDQLFNSSEKRLARTLLLLARYGQDDKPQGVLPKISQETLAEMVGTTRSRVNFFMNKFRKLGFIKYNGGLQINTSLLSIVLHD